MKLGICDDEAVVHHQVKEYINDIDFGIPLEVTDFYNGEALIESASQIDILLLDICMPGLDGIEVGRKLKGNVNIGKIIMLTSMLERSPEAFEIEAYRFITKPIDRKKLVNVIREAIDTFVGCTQIEVYLDNQKYRLWVSAIDNGISAWNNSSANVTISVSSSSKNYIEAAQFDDEWYGLTTQTCNILTGYTSKFVMQLNARTISSDATDYRKFIKSTVAHEFGHVFWLCDNPSTASKSIMKHRRDREKTTAPTTFDINNVNAKY